MTNLWVDDERPAPKDGEWHHSVTSRNAIFMLHRGTFEEISLDHDLGGDDTGMLVLEWMIEHDVWPQVLTIHTANPPARENMLRAANASAPSEVDIYIKYW